MKLFLDVETTITDRHGKDTPMPFVPENKLVSIGWALDDGPVEYMFFYHNDLTEHPVPQKVQQALDQATLLIGHNVKFDLMWLLECGFTYEGDLYDTMIAEYVLARGQSFDLTLEGSCKRRKVTLKLSELISDMFDNGIGFEAMPMATVEEYGRGDIISTRDLYHAQQALFKQENNKGLVGTLDLMNKFCRTLCTMERNGIAIDLEALEDIRKEYEAEKVSLTDTLTEIIHKHAGDTPVNLASPAQLSEFVYSRRVIDKHMWADVFGLEKDERGKHKFRPSMNAQQFAKNVRQLSVKTYKTKASQCPTCKGTGKIQKIKKDGKPFSKMNNCKDCSGVGIRYTPLKEYAGLKMAPRGIDDTTTNGFATNKETLGYLARIAKAQGNEDAEKFLTSMVRLNAVETYLSSFVGGINRNVIGVILHPRFNQTITATGRLSSSDPNFQNQPRGKTFPIRRAITSRFKGGSILEADFAQLEFRVAGILSGDPVIKQDIADGVDVHAYTASVLTENGQPTDRQSAKSRTFSPLYGGLSGTPAEVAYYRSFLQKYNRVAQWHMELQSEAIRDKKIRIPSGREYGFPGAHRLRNGNSTYRTQICNYPVQGFATGDIVPLACILVDAALQAAKLNTLMVNTVHDSIVLDVYPGEEDAALELILRCMTDDLLVAMRDLWGIELEIPLAAEVKIGPNWLDGKVVATKQMTL